MLNDLEKYNDELLAQRIEQYIVENIDCRITLQELATRFNVSPTKLKIIFKNTYSIPIYQYTKIKKIEYSKNLLIENKLTIMQIAGCVGYDNSSKFSKVFKEIVGISPSEYRKNQK